MSAGECAYLLLDDPFDESRELTDMHLALVARGACITRVTPKRERWFVMLEAARKAYIELDRRACGVIIAGTGYGAALAMLLAEQYSPEALVAIDPPLMNRLIWKREARCLVRHARKNMFLIIADVLVIRQRPEKRYDKAVSALLSGVNSKRREHMTASRDLWLNCDNTESKRVFEFIRCYETINTLAK